MREVVRGPGVPSPGGPYSPGVRIGNVVPRPAWTTVFVGLGEGMLVEIDALAVIA